MNVVDVNVIVTQYLNTNNLDAYNELSIHYNSTEIMKDLHNMNK